MWPRVMSQSRSSMRRHARLRRRRRRRVTALAAAITILPAAARAADFYWVNAGGGWNDPVNHWSPTPSGNPGPLAPGAGDNAFITAAEPTPYNVVYTNPGFTAKLASLTLDDVASAVVSLSQSVDYLAASTAYIGRDGSAHAQQSGSGTSAFGTLFLGYNAAAGGTWSLSDSAQLTTTTSFIGYGGHGAFNQHGGTYAVASALVVGG